MVALSSRSDEVDDSCRASCGPLMVQMNESKRIHKLGYQVRKRQKEERDHLLVTHLLTICMWVV